jgi:tRNA pseudouridine55 synthase
MITKKGSNNFPDYDFYSGEIILLDKPLNWTSFDVVSKCRNAVGVKKVGHTGTLDPMATGLLIICTGKKTKEISSFQDLEKTYTGSILLGKRSKSMDLETELIGDEDISKVTDEAIYKARDKFIGDIMQIPPMYSAIKHKGKSLYNIARKGKKIELQPREVKISKFEILEINRPHIKFEIICSKGTYIRSIANDLGDELDCGGVLSSLRRTAIGEYSVDDALSVGEFVSLTKEWKAYSEKETLEYVQ